MALMPICILLLSCSHQHVFHSARCSMCSSLHTIMVCDNIACAAIHMAP